MHISTVYKFTKFIENIILISNGSGLCSLLVFLLYYQRYYCVFYMILSKVNKSEKLISSIFKSENREQVKET